MCTPEAVRRYRARISAPLLDRIDLQIEVPRVPLAELGASTAGGESTADVRRRVVAARDRQQARAGKPNVALDNREVQRDCTLVGSDRDLLVRSLDRLGLSARAYHRILRVARTIADLAGEESIRTPHLTEAIQYRRLITQNR